MFRLSVFFILYICSISDYRMAPGVKPNDDQFPLWGCSCAENCRMSAYARYEVSIDSDDENSLAPAPAPAPSTCDTPSINMSMSTPDAPAESCAPASVARELEIRFLDAEAPINTANTNETEVALSNKSQSGSSSPVIVSPVSTSHVIATTAKSNSKSKKNKKKPQKKGPKGPNPALQCCSSHSLYHDEGINCAYDLNRCVKYGLGVKLPHSVTYYINIVELNRVE